MQFPGFDDRTKLEILAYPAILIVFIGTVFGLFVGAAKFLTGNINIAIATPDEAAVKSQLIRIDITGYGMIAKKISLSAGTERSEAPTTTQTTPAGSTSTGTVGATAATTPAVQALEQPETPLSTAIFNSTTKSGVAGTLKDDLVQAGIPVAKTGNRQPQEATTTIFIDERAQTRPDTIDRVMAIVKKRFSVQGPTLSETNGPYDIVIVIGTK